MEVSSKLHTLDALALGENPLVPIVEEDGLTLEPVWALWSREKFLAP
jgi:hypothetical protein